MNDTTANPTADGAEEKHAAPVVPDDRIAAVEELSPELQAMVHRWRDDVDKMVKECEKVPEGHAAFHQEPDGYGAIY